MKEKSRLTLNGVPFGTGTVCRSCEKEVREYCWIVQICDRGLTDIGRPKVKGSK